MVREEGEGGGVALSGVHTKNKTMVCVIVQADKYNVNLFTCETLFTDILHSAFVILIPTVSRWSPL